MVIDLGSCWVPADSEFISIVVPAGFLLNQKKILQWFLLMLLSSCYLDKLIVIDLGSCWVPAESEKNFIMVPAEFLQKQKNIQQLFLPGSC